MLISITVCSFVKNKEEFETQLFGNVLEFCLAHLEHKIHAEYVWEFGRDLDSEVDAYDQRFSQ